MTLSLAHWAPLSWYAAALREEVLTLEAFEHYQKGSLRNRCYIAGPGGPQRLSIPLESGKHQQKPVRDVLLAGHGDWQRNHWRSIRTAYGNAPYFEHFADEIAVFYEKKYTHLFDYNLEILNWTLHRIFRWKGKIELTTNWQGPEGQWAVADNTAAAISPGPAYPQVFSDRFGFLPNLSVLDAIFCCGKNITLE